MWVPTLRRTALLVSVTALLGLVSGCSDRAPSGWSATGPAADGAKAFVEKFQAALRDGASDNACRYLETSLRSGVQRSAARNGRSCESELVHWQNDVRATRATLLLPIWRVAAFSSARGIGATVWLRGHGRVGHTTEGSRALGVSKPAGGDWGIDNLSYE